MIEDENSFKDSPFEDKIKMMDLMTKQQKREGLENTQHICKDYCGKCPSRLRTGETKLAFCIIGKSSVIKEKKDCLCKTCPIYRTMNLRWEHYCIDGNAQEQSNAEKE